MKSVKMQRTALWLIVSALLPISVFAQQQPFSQPYVHTLRTYVEGDETSFPLIELNSGGRVIVEFDILDSNIADLEYSLRHCNSSCFRQPGIHLHHSGYKASYVERFPVLQPKQSLPQGLREGGRTGR